MAFVESAFEHGKFFKFSIKVVIRILKTWILLKVLSLSNLNCHSLDLCLEVSSLLKCIHKLWAVVSVDWLIA